MVTRFIEAIADRITGRAPRGSSRSSRWRTVRNQYLTAHPLCEMCGSEKKLVVHHKLPYYLFPDKELDADNLMTLCNRDHFLLGHLGSWMKFNPSVDADCAWWRSKIQRK